MISDKNLRYCTPRCRIQRTRNGILKSISRLENADRIHPFHCSGFDDDNDDISVCYAERATVNGITGKRTSVRCGGGGMTLEFTVSKIWIRKNYVSSLRNYGVFDWWRYSQTGLDTLVVTLSVSVLIFPLLIQGTNTAATQRQYEMNTQTTHTNYKWTLVGHKISLLLLMFNGRRDAPKMRLIPFYMRAPRLNDNYLSEWICFIPYPKPALDWYIE